MSTQPVISDQLSEVIYPHLLAAGFKAGEPSRNPYGRPKYKLMSDAMARKLETQVDGSGETNADLIAEKLVQQGKAGDVASIIVLRDTTEGRPAQQITMDANISIESPEERKARLFMMMQALALPQEVEP